MKKPLLGLAFTISLIGLTACNGDNNNDNNIARNNNNNNMNVNTVRKANQNNGKLRLSTLAERRVERMDEVDDARVIVRNNDAYVAVRLKGNTKNGTAGNNNTTTTNNSGNALNLGNGGDANLNNTGLSGGTTTGTTNNMNGNMTNNNTVGPTGYGTTGSNTNMAGYNNQTGTNGTNGNNNTLGTNQVNNNFNRTGTDHLDNNNNGTNKGANTYSDISNKLEQRIADQVRSADKSIHKVYVSYDTNFYNRMGNFTNNLTNGRNGDGLLDDFGDTVRRFFR
ncbi:YhcN/YlaJ family sporulation lipoprotein [Neobacillus dielmonensis]|uniref:YhcN/YlaJ family sporulation lipoprotein n=1 Tax=Neobacillus dielmonensis TaxID=1347369 RepID=UPI0005A7E865|nr:YhcN/YlaJ family sporulation lipoprotein [Neobacillus dielmonensis]